MLRAAIHGTGRMAAAISGLAADRDDVELLALAGPQAPEWPDGPPWCGALEDLPEIPELLIDFTLPDGTRVAADWCARNRVPLLSGVTGLTPEARSALENAAAVVPVLWSPNLSLGVNLLADLAARAAAVLDDDTPVVIDDVHHQWKKDAPSGTALMLGERIASERGADSSGIRYTSVREGETVGVHTVTFRMGAEEVSLVHTAHERSIYAQGALDAGGWLIGQAPGLYSAADWLAGRGRNGTER
jgi:4-hydroxy-tetrahydrodipicolinate reductase